MNVIENALKRAKRMEAVGEVGALVPRDVKSATKSAGANLAMNVTRLLLTVWTRTIVTQPVA